MLVLYSTRKSNCSCGVLKFVLVPERGRGMVRGGGGVVSYKWIKRTTYNAVVWQDTYASLFFSKWSNSYQKL